MARPVDKGPKKAGAWAQRPNPPNTEFRRFYERGDLPIVLSHSSRKSACTGRWDAWPSGRRGRRCRAPRGLGDATLTLAAQVDIATLDYCHYLPIFFDGIRETTDPLRFMAIRVGARPAAAQCACGPSAPGVPACP